MKRNSKRRSHRASIDRWIDGSTPRSSSSSHTSDDDGSTPRTWTRHTSDDDDDDDDEGYRGMASDETMDDAPRASDEAREPLLKRVGASVEGTSMMNHRLMKNPKFRALLVESVRGTRRDATRRDATVNSHARRLT